VIGVDNFRTGRPENLASAEASPHFDFYRLDVLEPGALRDLCRSTAPEAIIHLAALVSVPESFQDPALNWRLNFEGTQRVTEAAREIASVRRVVFASSAAVYGDSTALPLSETTPCTPLSPYGEAKLASEKFLAEFSRAEPRVTTISFRYFNVYGPRQDPRSPYSGVISRFAEALRRNEPPTIHGDGEQSRDFVAVADVVRANALAATAREVGSDILNVCTGRSVSLKMLIATMARELGRAVAPQHAPARTGDIRHSLGAPARAAEQLGFRPELDLAAGLRALFTANRR
jgi:UDP-glucose 4-epimerase